MTIGCGYDLGYHSLAEFTADWKSRPLPTDFNRLKTTVGKKGQAALNAMATVHDVRIPWDDAIAVFDARTLPKYVARTFANLPSGTLDALPADCVQHADQSGVQPGRIVPPERSALSRNACHSRAS